MRCMQAACIVWMGRVFGCTHSPCRCRPPSPICPQHRPPRTCSTVRRAPSLMVPPLCVVEISGMKTTAGCCVAWLNSVLLASARPSTLRANSITAICAHHGVKWGWCQGQGAREGGRGVKGAGPAKAKGSCCASAKALGLGPETHDPKRAGRTAGHVCPPSLCQPRTASPRAHGLPDPVGTTHHSVPQHLLNKTLQQRVADGRPPPPHSLAQGPLHCTHAPVLPAPAHAALLYAQGGQATAQ